MKIDIAAISPDVANFRHDKAATERDAIQYLLSNEKVHKVSELADDIVAQGGLDPSSLLIVTADPNDSARYIALEGNRRITALKALMTPDLAKGMPGQKRFEALHASFLELRITSVECVVMDRSQAAVWIKRKHYKGVGGAGVVAWNAVATARSDAAEGRYSRWMTALAFLEQHEVEAEGIRDLIAGKTTTVERVLSSTHISSVLGLSFEKDGTVTPENGDEVAAVRLLQKLLEEMSERSFVETKVSNSDQQREFINRFVPLSVKRPAPSGGGKAASTSGAAAGVLPGADKGGAGAGDDSKPTGTSPGTGATGSRAKPVKIRKMLAAPGLRISNRSLNQFYSELRRLNVEKNPFIASAMIRIFLEKASTVFLEAKHVPTPNPAPDASWQDFNVKLKTKVSGVLGVIDPTGASPKLKDARDVANGNRDKLHTADNLNRSIHSHHSLPSHTEIVTIWDRYHGYFVELFDDIEKHSKP